MASRSQCPLGGCGAHHPVRITRAGRLALPGPDRRGPPVIRRPATLLPGHDRFD